MPLCPPPPTPQAPTCDDSLVVGLPRQGRQPLLLQAGLGHRGPALEAYHGARQAAHLVMQLSHLWVRGGEGKVRVKGRAGQ